MNDQPTYDAPVNLWTSTAHALDYLARADSIPHRTEGEATLLEALPLRVARVLDLGSGDGRLLSLVKLARPDAGAVALDFSEAMIAKLHERFASTPSVIVIRHDMDLPLPESLGAFDAVVSSFAIHHLVHTRKRALYEEIHRHLTSGGVFCNLEHVSSATDALHQHFLRCLSVRPGEEDPSNKLLDLETQLAWLREIGFVNVDCLWKWRELALLTATKPT